MSFVERVREYAKLTRSFNMALTGMAPVFGALSMLEFDALRLFVLFILGCSAHVYGFVLNDYIDVRIDKHSKELIERPLVRGSISPKNAFALAISGLIIMIILGIYLTFPRILPVVILILAAASATVYNLISKKAVGMDFFVGGAVALLTLFGSMSVSTKISLLAIDIVLLAFLQVMFMNIVAGGLKDIDHDYKAGGRNIAIAMGCKVVDDGENINLIIPKSFKTLSHSLEFLFIACVLAPFFLDYEPFEKFHFMSIQFFIIIILACAMLIASTNLMAMHEFIRPKMRKIIGIHYVLNFSLVPVMLSVLSLGIVLLAFVPPLGFALSNKILHGDPLSPKTM